MLSHKLSNLLKLYRTASRIGNVQTIIHCSNEFNKVLSKIGGRDVDPVAGLYLKELNQIHKESGHILKSKNVQGIAA